MCVEQARYTVFWQPGCTSCLKTKELLTRNGIEFESVNVRTDPDALNRLASLGARSIPVIMRGAAWTYGQDLDDVARFIGAAPDRATLPAATLSVRIERLLSAAGRYTAGLPDVALETLLPGRSDRACADLAWHVPMIVAAFLAAVRGGILSFDYFEHRPTGEQRSRAALLSKQSDLAGQFMDWWRSAPDPLPVMVDTYYGRRPTATVLERTAWHMAQHVRQLESLLRHHGCEADGPLTDAELGGLPLPEGVWDPEIGKP